MSEKIEFINSSQDHLAVIKEIVSKENIDQSVVDLLDLKALEMKLKLVFDFVKSKVEYKKNGNITKENNQYIYTNATDYLEQGYASIDGFGVLIGSILSKMGIPFHYRMLKTKPNSDYNHLYIIVPKKVGADLKKRKNYFVLDVLEKSFDEEYKGAGERITV